MCLPVWREWKLNCRIQGIMSILLVYMCLPVWRESKRCSVNGDLIIRDDLSTCAFPFGGNRNPSSQTVPETRMGSCLHVPSRLEGMETEPLQVRSRSFCWSTCAFPFGGNRNAPPGFRVVKCSLSLHVPSRLEGIETLLIQQSLRRQARPVYMCLPVWRESKLQFPVPVMKMILGLHVPSRLEGIETYFC